MSRHEEVTNYVFSEAKKSETIPKNGSSMEGGKKLSKLKLVLFGIRSK